DSAQCAKDDGWSDPAIARSRTSAKLHRPTAGLARPCATALPEPRDVKASKLRHLAAAALARRRYPARPAHLASDAASRLHTSRPAGNSHLVAQPDTASV